MLPAPRLRAPWTRALLALVAASMAFALTLALGLEELPSLMPVLAVLVSALYGGFGAGLLAGVLTIGSVNYAFVEPRGAFRWPSLVDAYHLGMFAIVAAVISLLASRQRHAQGTMLATLASIGDGVIVTDLAGRITFLNAVAEQLTGWTAARAMDQRVADVFRILDEDTRQPLPNPLDRAVREGVPGRLDQPAILIARDGTERPISDSAAPVRDTEGRMIGAVLIFRDASQQRASERAIRDQAAERERLLQATEAARAEAERANRVKDEFLATLSHELRTPLSAVTGWAHMLLTRAFGEEDRMRAVKAIHRNAAAQARLVDDLLDLSRIVTGRLAIESRPVDLRDVVRSAAEAVMPAAIAKHQQLDLDLGGEAIVMGDSHRLRQISWNLLANAAKFTPEHGTISARVARADDTVEFTVTDTGEGIDPAFLPFVFEPFRQADSTTTRVHAGLGLGLALVRQLVEAHGGTVHALSEGRGRGATMQVRLPAAVADAARDHEKLVTARPR